MKKIIKALVQVILLPISLFYNDFTIKIFGRIKAYIVGNTFGIAHCKRMNYAQCTTYPYIVGGKFMTIEGKITMGRRNRFECISNYFGQTFNPELVIEDGVSFGHDCHIGCIEKIRIGQDTLIGSNVLITDHAHGDMSQMDKPPIYRDLISKRGGYLLERSAG